MILPFIDEERVLRVIETQHCDEGLTEKEKVRNSFEKELFMTYAESPRVFASPLDRQYYPDIIDSHCTVLELDGYAPVFAALEAADHHDKTAVFSSIYPFCVGIQHPHPQQEKRKFQLTDSVMCGGGGLLRLPLHQQPAVAPGAGAAVLRAVRAVRVPAVQDRTGDGAVHVRVRVRVRAGAGQGRGVHSHVHVTQGREGPG